VGLLFISLLLISGCSNEQNVATNDDKSITTNQEEMKRMESELESLKKENEFLKSQLVDYSANLQRLDHTSRKIIKLISQKKFGELKSEFSVEFDVEDNKVLFKGFEDSPVSVELSHLPMYFVYYNPQAEQSEVGYFLYDAERKYSIVFVFGKEKEFKHIYLGEA
jgi:ribosomal protein L25 (general stress protein Ctc)